ncbi:response regulator transcription factor [Paenarthrobacter sp. NPDC056912]|uniref:helix-turn-helix transcriptional regulator n=1 Tax=Paenarthrobacter sp. NPDC056912 TaxID=3345965 RepID=UPI00366DF304
MHKVSVVVGALDTQLHSVLSAIFRFNSQTRALFSRATSPLELAADCRAHEADLVVVDARSSRGYATPNLLPVLSFYPQAHLMVFIDAVASEGILDIMDAGARGIVTSDASVREIQNAVSEVTAGHVFLSRSALIGLLEVLRRERPAERTPSRKDLPALTLRERDVVECLGKGRSNRDIAKKLGVSEAAVKGHLSRIMAKWCVQDRLQVLVAALEAGEVRVG